MFRNILLRNNLSSLRVINLMTDTLLQPTVGYRIIGRLLLWFITLIPDIKNFRSSPESMTSWPC